MEPRAHTTVRISPNESRFADLSDFVNVASALRNSLSNVWRCWTNDADEMEFQISGLGIGSAILEASPTHERQITGEHVIDLFNETIEAIQHGRALHPLIDYSTIHALNGFSGVAKRAGVSLSVGGTTLTKDYAERIAAILEPESKALGSVSGKLLEVSIHGSSRFKLYPSASGEDVECVFRREELDEVLKAVDRTVTVFGTLHYAKTKAFPVRVDVDSFEIHPPSSELPTLLDACGLLQLDTDSVSTIREMRDGRDQTTVTSSRQSSPSSSPTLHTP